MGAPTNTLWPLILAWLAVTAPPVGGGRGMLADTAARPGEAEAQGPPRVTRDTTVTTFIVVRHAEKDTTFLGHDLPLSDAGRKRAKALARVLADFGVTRIYATPTARAMQTGEPLARQIGDSLRIVDDTNQLLKRLRAHRAGDVVLVIGHSDTVPEIVKGLSGRAIPNIRAGEFDLLFVVTVERRGASHLMRFHYGDPS
jgi:phosphohistidine phosphatase SixA